MRRTIQPSRMMATNTSMPGRLCRSRKARPTRPGAKVTQQGREQSAFRARVAALLEQAVAGAGAGAGDIGLVVHFLGDVPEQCFGLVFDPFPPLDERACQGGEAFVVGAGIRFDVEMLPF